MIGQMNFAGARICLIMPLINYEKLVLVNKIGKRVNPPPVGWNNNRIFADG
jgi:hypothetical protein